MNLRSKRVGSVLHREVQSVLDGSLADPRLDSMITVTRVAITDDLHEAIIHVSVMPEKRESVVIHGLRDAAAYIRREASKRIDMRRTPSLVFKIDRSLKDEASFLNTLSQVKNESSSEENAQPTVGDEPANDSGIEEPSD